MPRSNCAEGNTLHDLLYIIFLEIYGLKAKLYVIIIASNLAAELLKLFFVLLTEFVVDLYLFVREGAGSFSLSYIW